MKRLLCVLLILCVLPVCASALDLDEFNTCSVVMGASELDIANAKIAGQYTGFIQDNCFIYFDEEGGKLKNIFIDGQGDSFLAYCCAAIHVFDLNGDKTRNYGQLLIMYMLSHTEEGHRTGQTSNGTFFFMEQSEKGFMFMIGES